MQSKRVILSRNIVFALVLQITNLVSGLIVPRIILGCFGSEVNGLIQSVSQFLNYVTLLEGGLCGVIMANLYKPLQQRDEKALSGIVNASRRFFRKISYIYLVYVLLVSIVYPLFVKTQFSYRYVLALIWVLAAGLYSQYFFSLSFKLLIQADQKDFIASAVRSVLLLLNVTATVIAVRVFRDILAVEIISVLIFLIQPLVLARYAKKHYRLDLSEEPDQGAISQRWDGFWQNIAYFIHTNTDIVLLTLFSTLPEVSVYSVYMLVINALRTLIISISGAVVPTLGNTLAGGDKKEIEAGFDHYEFSIFAITTFLFACGASLIVPFVSVYTKGVTDADYCRPVFAILILLAEAIYCLRDPYVSVTYAAGHFRQTRTVAVLEAAINILISVLLIRPFGLAGVAAGTLCAMLFRMIAHILYLRKAILFREAKRAFKMVFLSLAILFSVFAVSRLWIGNDPSTYLRWIVQAIQVSLLTAALILACSFVFYKKEIAAIRDLLRRRKKTEES